MKILGNMRTRIAAGALLALVALPAGFGLVVRPWLIGWGATSEEKAATLPGDALVAAPEVQRTKAITIKAPAKFVWLWLVQIGQNKAGFYSYEFIENRLLGCNIKNSDRVLAEWQDIQVGDLVLMYPPEKNGPPPYIVAAIEPERALILGHQDDAGRWTDTWQFVLEPIDGGHTRLIMRTRMFSMGIWDAMDTGYSLMERGMLLGLRSRAEAYARNWPFVSLAE